jgi:hypothetical protein
MSYVEEAHALRLRTTAHVRELGQFSVDETHRALRSKARRHRKSENFWYDNPTREKRYAKKYIESRGCRFHKGSRTCGGSPLLLQMLVVDTNTDADSN